MIAALAARQHGVLTHNQLRYLGLSASGIRSRVAAGRLIPVYRSVYAVGHAKLSLKGLWTAAVAGFGADAALSHRSAAALWDLRRSERSRIDVTVPCRGPRPRTGIDLHRSTTLTAADVTRHDNIPVTSVARTLLDLTEVIDEQSVARACERARVLRLFDLKEVEDVLARANGRHGAPTLEAVVCQLHPTETHTRSDLEDAFLALTAGANLPIPQANRAFTMDDGTTVIPDFLFEDQKLAVETDSEQWHSSPSARERDARKTQLLTLLGYRVVRFTWKQVFFEPAYVTTVLTGLLKS